ncbi:hypothetical protein MRX96_017779 [Rhipicephalus microplus]
MAATRDAVDAVPLSQVVERLVNMLDQVEKRVELLREHAASLEQERKGLVDTLSSVAASQELTSLTPDSEVVYSFEKELSTAELREEVSLTIERLQMRVKSVDVSVTTPRSEEQEAALAQIEQYVTNLVRRMTSDPKGARQRGQVGEQPRPLRKISYSVFWVLFTLHMASSTAGGPGQPMVDAKPEKGRHTLPRYYGALDG